MLQQKHDSAFFYCPVCKELTENNAKRTKVYCSVYCRQRAYREYKKGNKGEIDVTTPIYDRATATRRQSLKVKTCPTCRHGFEVDGLHGTQKFCSNACKQKYHRAVKAYQKRYESHQPAPQPAALPADPMAALNAQLERAMEMQALGEQPNEPTQGDPRVYAVFRNGATLGYQKFARMDQACNPEAQGIKPKGYPRAVWTGEIYTEEEILSMKFGTATEPKAPSIQQMPDDLTTEEYETLIKAGRYIMESGGSCWLPGVVVERSFDGVVMAFPYRNLLESLIKKGYLVQVCGQRFQTPANPRGTAQTLTDKARRMSLNFVKN